MPPSSYGTQERNRSHPHVHGPVKTEWVGSAPYRISFISGHIAEIQGIGKIVNNVVVFDEDEQHMEHVWEILHHCEEREISLNRGKFQFCHPYTHFAGFVLTSEGYSISNDIIDAITNFPTPSSHTDLHSFVTLTNQLMSCTKQLAPALTLLWLLLSACNDFLFTAHHDIAFQQAKHLPTTAPVLTYFDHSNKKIVSTWMSALLV